MRKYLFAIIIILIPCYALAVVPKVSDLYPNSKVFDVVSKTWTVPAKVLAKSSTSIAYDSVALGLTKSIAGGLVMSLVLGGLSYLGNEYLDWLMGQGMYYNDDGVLVKDVANNVPNQEFMNELLAQGISLNQYLGTCASTGLLECPAPTHSCPAGYTPSNGEYYSNMFTTPGTNILMRLCGGSCLIRMGNYSVPEANKWCSNSSPPMNQVVTPTPVPNTDVEDLVNNAINDVTDENDKIVDVVNESIDKAAELVRNGAGIAANTGTVAANVENVLNQAVPGDEADKLDEKLNSPTADDDYKEEAEKKAKEVTKDDITDAVKKAINDANGTAIVPSSPTVLLPTKLSLTSIMQSFMNSINSMPIISTLRGITVNASGSSVLCVDLPANYGGSKCYDAASAQSTFNMIGTILLSMTTIFCFIQLFRG